MRRLSIPVLAVALAAACASTPPRTAPARPQAQPAPARAANALTPVATPAPAVAAPSIRVGLVSDQTSVSFPRAEGGYVLVSGEGASTLRRGFTAAAPLANASVRYAVQMAAISDQTSASSLAQRLRTETGLRVDTSFDPASGTYKILAGDFASSDEASPARASLIERGYGKDLLVVRRPASEEFAKRIRITDDEGDSHTFEGATLAIFPADGSTIAIAGQPYRTSARLFVNPRGLLNVINELNLEEYLYGVVPAEMGPTIYDELEALKAQAVAARTYAIRNLRQFESEGYDICPGPACQAYKGFSGEHELSTRAVKETSGLVLTYGGELIDSLYSATCGGETSDVSTMFPGRNEPYLKAVRCVELEMVEMDGRRDSDLLTEQQVAAQLFTAVAGVTPDLRSWNAGEAARATIAALQRAGMNTAGAGAPRSARRGDVLEWVSRLLGLDAKAAALILPEDREYFFPRSSAAAAPYGAAAFLIKYGIVPAQYIDRVDLSAPMPREELYALLGSWLREQSALRDVEGKILGVTGRRITLKQKGETTAYDLPAGLPMFRRLSDRYQEYARVPILPGDRATIVLGAGSRPVAMIVQANYDGAAFDRTSSYSNWTRSYRASELVTSINRRNPIRELQGIRPLTIDASKRVAELEVTAEGGRTFVLRGLPVRWSLGLPDNLFVYDRSKDPDGEDRYTFYGKGWGHGTGMCQVGAYGMAFRGWTFDRILKHYYTGVEIEKR